MASIVDWSRRPTYSLEQLQRYYDRIALPQKYRTSGIALDVTDHEKALAFLQVLQRYQLAAVPFENLSLHYSVHRTISTDPQRIFDKIVNGNSGRGGYCMENSCLFGTVLRSLGYDVYSVGGRVNEAAQAISASKNWRGPKYDGWNHMVNIVAIGEKKYLVDVGFGSNGPHQPLALVPGIEVHNYGDQHVRLVTGPIPQHTNRTQTLWQYELRNGDSDWIPGYCFSEMEFLPEDFAIMNYFVSTNKGSWFTFYVVCVRMLLDEEGNKVIGDLTLFNNTLKRRVGAQSEILETFTSDDERVAALARHFDLYVSKEDRDSIRYTIAEIL